MRMDIFKKRYIAPRTASYAFQKQWAGGRTKKERKKQQQQQKHIQHFSLAVDYLKKADLLRLTPKTSYTDRGPVREDLFYVFNGMTHEIAINDEEEEEEEEEEILLASCRHVCIAKYRTKVYICSILVGVDDE